MRLITLLLLLSTLIIPRTMAASIGGGVHYNRFIEDVELDALDQEAFSYTLALRSDTAGLVSFEWALEAKPEELTGTGEPAYIPQAFALVGQGLYAGVGAGLPITDGSAEDPEFYLRAGFNLQLLGSVYLDLFARYTFTEEPDDGVLRGVDTDSVTAGLNIRLML